MLRVTIHETDDGPKMELEGRISGPWVDELDRAWHSLAPLEGAERLCIDIRNVAFADSRGRELLRRMCLETKSCFLADTPLTQMYAAEAERLSAKNGKGGTDDARS